MRVLLTGMSGAGKSALVQELKRRGYEARDADDDGFSEPRADGRWGWRIEQVAEYLERDGLVFFAGCSEEQAELPFDHRVLLTAPRAVLVERLATRTGNRYGRDGAELAQVLADRDEVEPRLLRSADLVLTTTVPPDRLADELLERLGVAPLVSREQVQRWLDAYVRAWRSNEPAAIGELFAPGATYAFSPYAEPAHGIEAIAAAWLKDPDDPSSWEAAYAPLLIEGRRAVATGETRYEAEGGHVFSNLFELEFGDDGRCTRFVEWYVEHPRR